MHSALSRNTFLVKEHLGLFQAANTFDIFDPLTGEAVLHCREERLGTIAKLLRKLIVTTMTCIDLVLKE